MTSFHRSYYLWAKKEVDAQIKSDSAFVTGLQTDAGNRFLGVLRVMPESEMHETWNSLLKRFHDVRAAAADDPISSKDDAAIKRYEELFGLSFAAVEPKISDEPLVSRQAFRSAAGSAIKDLLKINPEERGGGLVRFVTRHQNCVVHTYLEAGSRYEQLCYWHNVVASNGDVLREWCSALQWLGISGQTSWSDVSRRSLEDVITAMVGAVKKFIDFCDGQWISGSQQ